MSAKRIRGKNFKEYEKNQPFDITYIRVYRKNINIAASSKIKRRTALQWPEKTWHGKRLQVAIKQGAEASNNCIPVPA
jgi:hypothetical protein